MMGVRNLLHTGAFRGVGCMISGEKAQGNRTLEP